jgi:hypothetical protein
MLSKRKLIKMQSNDCYFFTFAYLSVNVQNALPILSVTLTHIPANILSHTTLYIGAIYFGHCPLSQNKYTRGCGERLVSVFKEEEGQRTLVDFSLLLDVQ